MFLGGAKDRTKWFVDVPLPNEWRSCGKGGTILCKQFGPAPPPTPLIAAFDFDGTLAHTSFSDHTPSGWRFLFDEKEQTALLSRLVAAGYRLAILTNESPIGQAVKFETRRKAM